MNEDITNDKITDTEDLSETIQEDAADQAGQSVIDFEADLLAIEEAIPELTGRIDDFSKNERYSELRALGLSPKEAYLATISIENRRDSRSHLIGGVPKSASSPSFAMPKEELAIARSLFDDLDEGDIRKLYKKVTKQERNNYV